MNVILVDGEGMAKMSANQALHCHKDHGHEWGIEFGVGLTEKGAQDFTALVEQKSPPPEPFEAFTIELDELRGKPDAATELKVISEVFCRCCGIIYSDWQDILKEMPKN